MGSEMCRRDCSLSLSRLSCDPSPQGYRWRLFVFCGLMDLDPGGSRSPPTDKPDAWTRIRTMALAWAPVHTIHTLTCGFTAFTIYTVDSGHHLCSPFALYTTVRVPYLCPAIWQRILLCSERPISTIYHSILHALTAAVTRATKTWTSMVKGF